MRKDMFTIKKIVVDINTENDGHSWDAVRMAASYLLLPGIPVFFWGVIYNTLHSGHFDFNGFAWGMGGIASVIVSLAGGISMKARTDPIGSQPPQDEHHDPLT